METVGKKGTEKTKGKKGKTNQDGFQSKTPLIPLSKQHSNQFGDLPQQETRRQHSRVLEQMQLTGQQEFHFLFALKMGIRNHCLVKTKSKTKYEIPSLSFTVRAIYFTFILLIDLPWVRPGRPRLENREVFRDLISCGGVHRNSNLFRRVCWSGGVFASFLGRRNVYLVFVHTRKLHFTTKIQEDWKNTKLKAEKQNTSDSAKHLLTVLKNTTKKQNYGKASTKMTRRTLPQGTESCCSSCWEPLTSKILPHSCKPNPTSSSGAASTAQVNGWGPYQVDTTQTGSSRNTIERRTPSMDYSEEVAEALVYHTVLAA